MQGTRLENTSARKKLKGTEAVADNNFVLLASLLEMSLNRLLGRS